MNQWNSKKYMQSISLKKLVAIYKGKCENDDADPKELQWIDELIYTRSVKCDLIPLQYRKDIVPVLPSDHPIFNAKYLCQKISNTTKNGQMPKM